MCLTCKATVNLVTYNSSPACPTGPMIRLRSSETLRSRFFSLFETEAWEFMSLTFSFECLSVHLDLRASGGFRGCCGLFINRAEICLRLSPSPPLTTQKPHSGCPLFVPCRGEELLCRVHAYLRRLLCVYLSASIQL